jgi:hypothetical protein
MSASSSRSSIALFIREILRGTLFVLAGFAIAPTHLLYSFYETQALFRGIAIFIGILMAIWGLFYMLRISLTEIERRLQPTE